MTSGPETALRCARGHGDLAIVRRFCRAAFEWELAAFPELRETVVAHFRPETLEARLALLPGPFAPPSGDILLGLVDGTPVGQVMYRVQSDGIAEIARLFVGPEARGLGLGEALVRRAMQDAAARGAHELRFITARHLASAIRLYRALGFETRAPWQDITPGTETQILFMARAL